MKSKFELLTVFSVWISLVAAVCPVLVCLVYNVPYKPVWSIIAFLSAFYVYSIDKVSGSKEDLLNTPERAILANYPILRLANWSFWLAIIIAVLTDWHSVANVLVFCLAGRLYVAKVGGHRLKDIPGFKSPYVAGAWSYGFAGLVGQGYALIFLLFLINTILCDMRDMVGDRAAGVRTLPVLLGLSRTIAGLAVLNIALAFYSLPSAAIGFCILYYFRKPRPNLEYDLWVDGWPILSIVLIYVSGVFFK